MTCSKGPPELGLDRGLAAEKPVSSAYRVPALPTELTLRVAYMYMDAS